MCMSTQKFYQAKRDIPAFRMHKLHTQEGAERSIYANFFDHKSEKAGEMTQHCDRSRCGMTFIEQGSEAGWHVMLDYENVVEVAAESIVENENQDVVIREVIRELDELGLTVKEHQLTNPYGYPNKESMVSWIQEIMRLQDGVFSVRANDTGGWVHFMIRPVCIPAGTLFAKGLLSHSTIGSYKPCARTTRMRFTEPEEVIEPCVL